MPTLTDYIAEFPSGRAGALVACPGCGAPTTNPGTTTGLCPSCWGGVCPVCAGDSGTMATQCESCGRRACRACHEDIHETLTRAQCRSGRAPEAP